MLIQKYSKCASIFGDQCDSLVSQCSSDLKDFDVYRLGTLKESDISDIESTIQREIKANPRPYLDFFASLVKQVKGRASVEQKIQ